MDIEVFSLHTAEGALQWDLSSPRQARRSSRQGCVCETCEVDDARGAAHALLKAHAVADARADRAADLLRHPARDRERRLRYSMHACSP